MSYWSVLLTLLIAFKCILSTSAKLDAKLDKIGVTFLSKSEQGVNEAELSPDHLYIITDADTKAFQQMTADLSFTGLAKINCTALLIRRGMSCDELTDLPVQWSLPRDVRDYELIHEHRSSRIEFVPQKNYYINGKNGYIIKSEMKIKSVGAFHNGSYQCSQELLAPVPFDILARGRDERGGCEYDDQCLSFNCIKSQCKCQPNNVYVAQKDQCVPAVGWNESCTYNEQCLYKSDKGQAGCVSGQCTCLQGHTLCTFPQLRRSCLKIASLGDQCQHSDQCSKRDDQSFCSVTNHCECKTGYHIVANKCKAFNRCDSSQLGDNDNYTRGSCNVNEFCRDYICLCAPGYNFDGDGNCIAFNKPDGEEWYEKYGWYIVGGLAAVLLVVLVLIGFQTRRFRRLRRARTHTYSQ